MRVAFDAERAIEFLTTIRTTVKKPDVRARYGYTPVGMFNPSANVVILSARPSPSVSSSTFTESRPFVPGLAGYGYSSDVSRASQVHRLVDLRFRREQLNAKSGRQGKRLGGGRRCQRIRGPHARRERIRAPYRAHRQQHP